MASGKYFIVSTIFVNYFYFPFSSTTFLSSSYIQKKNSSMVTINSSLNGYSAGGNAKSRRKNWKLLLACIPIPYFLILGKGSSGSVMLIVSKSTISSAHSNGDNYLAKAANKS